VDLHFSFYYDIICKSERDKDLPQYYKKLADAYVHFISNLASINGVRCFVLAIYPSPVEAFRIPSQLSMYGVLTVDQILQLDMETWWEITNFRSRSHRLQLFNDSLRDACALTEGKVTFLSINDKLLHSDGTVRKEFIDLSPYNVHLLWEPLISLWAVELAKWDIGLDPSLLTDTTSSGKLYEQTKSKEIQDKNYGNFIVGPRLKDLLFFLLDQCKRLENLQEELNLPPEITLIEKNEKETEIESSHDGLATKGNNTVEKSSAADAQSSQLVSSLASSLVILEPLEEDRPQPSISAIPLEQIPNQRSRNDYSSQFRVHERRGEDASQSRFRGSSEGQQQQLYCHPNSRGGRNPNYGSQYHGGSKGDDGGHRQGGYVIYPPSAGENTDNTALESRAPSYRQHYNSAGLNDSRNLPPPPVANVPYGRGRGSGGRQQDRSAYQNRGANASYDRNGGGGNRRYSRGGSSAAESTPRELSWRDRAKVDVDSTTKHTSES
jgi:hypothetical protein